ncbi:hypothetical protein AB0K93_19950 [Streptomyces sp. NPDC052676]|uniref:hypothetical protein n=1 Tax=Streptomyces sp. NPDC052676 TaxID=3154953 RepID=UPI0034491BCD
MPEYPTNSVCWPRRWLGVLLGFPTALAGAVHLLVAGAPSGRSCCGRAPGRTRSAC